MLGVLSNAITVIFVSANAVRFGACDAVESDRKLPRSLWRSVNHSCLVVGGHQRALRLAWTNSAGFFMTKSTPSGRILLEHRSHFSPTSGLVCRCCLSVRSTIGVPIVTCLHRVRRIHKIRIHVCFRARRPPQNPTEKLFRGIRGLTNPGNSAESEDYRCPSSVRLTLYLEE